MYIIRNIQNYASPKTEMLFKQFCISLDADHVKILMHTEIIWLYIDNCFIRFIEMYEHILQFLHDD